MKKFILPAVMLIVIVSGSAAQNTGDAGSIVKEAVQLNNNGLYTEAIAKYTQALKLDSTNLYANYGIAFSLLQAGRGDQGIPYLQKVIGSNTKLTAWAYDLLGSVYDQDRQSAKAIDAYKAGIKSDPGYEELYYNLGLVYFRDKNYPEAEKCAVKSIRLNPEHAASQRMYALVCFHQNKRANALLGLCSFILLDPQSSLAAGAWRNIQSILKGGRLKPEPDAKISPPDTQTLSLNAAILRGAAEAGHNRYATGAGRLAAQMKLIFTAIGQLADKQNDDTFFRNYLADYFAKLAQSANMPAFACLLSQVEPESAAWIRSNPQAMAALDSWVKATPRSF